jgi:hypothetical protein
MISGKSPIETGKLSNDYTLALGRGLLRFPVSRPVGGQRAGDHLGPKTVGNAKAVNCFTLRCC